ncbi:aminopeptidase, partial [Reticulomyxa filosa]
DLSVAGRVTVTGDKEEKESFHSRLARVDRPILRISNLAIHLNRGVNETGFQFNQETQTVPVLATEFAAQSNKTVTCFFFIKKKKKNLKTMNSSIVNIFAHFLHCDEIQFNESTKSPMNEDCHPMLLKLLAKELNVDPEQIHDFELYLYDTHKSCLGGALNEFIYSARLDNLMSCFVCLRALLRANSADSFASETNIRVLACFDNEEIGSNSNRGAASNLLLSS